MEPEYRDDGTEFELGLGPKGSLNVVSSGGFRYAPERIEKKARLVCSWYGSCREPGRRLSSGQHAERCRVKAYSALATGTRHYHAPDPIDALASLRRLDVLRRIVLIPSSELLLHFGRRDADRDEDEYEDGRPVDHIGRLLARIDNHGDLTGMETAAHVKVRVYLGTIVQARLALGSNEASWLESAANTLASAEFWQKALAIARTLPRATLTAVVERVDQQPSETSGSSSSSSSDEESVARKRSRQFPGTIHIHLVGF